MTRERPGTRGRTWETEVCPVEVYVDGEWTAVDGIESVTLPPARIVEEPAEPYRPNRATRRALARAARRRKT